MDDAILRSVLRTEIMVRDFIAMQFKMRTGQIKEYYDEVCDNVDKMFEEMRGDGEDE